MKILFILENHYPNIGGVETLFKTLTEELVKKGFEVTVLTNKFSKKLAPTEILNGVHIRRLSLFNRYLFTFLAFIPAIKHARSHDIIHTTSYNAAIPAYIAQLLTRKKTIITFHEVWGQLWFKLPYMNKFSLSLHYLFEQFILKLGFHKFIAVSDSTKNALIQSGINNKKIEVIHNGIDYNQFKTKSEKKPNSDFTFLYFGRLGISKGLDILLDAITLLKSSKKTFKLKLIIPTEPSGFNKRIRDFIQKNKISPIVEILSDLPKEELINIVSNADAVVIPSYSEGFCFTAVEAMALDRPIISSGKAALKEVVSGRHLTMPSHNAQGLVQCMERALDNDWDITTSKKFELSDSVKRYIQLYEKMMLEI